MSKRTRALILAAVVAALNLASTIAIAQAQANDQPVRRPPTQGQVGESYRNDHDALAAQADRQADAVERFRRGERASQDQPTIADGTRRPPTEAKVGESWRHPVNVPVRPAEPTRQPGWLIASSLGVLVAGLALTGGLAVTTTRRARRRVRAGEAA
jgi:hypothetical protein